MVWPYAAPLGLQEHRGQCEDEEENHQHDSEIEQRPLRTAACPVDASVAAAAKDPSQSLPFDLKKNGNDETSRDYDLHNLQVETHVKTS